MEGALQSVSLRHPVRTVFDIGASDGSWSELARKHYPDAHYLLIEAQSNPHEPALRRYVAQHPRFEYLIAAAGHREGSIHFDATDPFGGVASDQPTGQHDIVIPVTTVDLEVARRKLPPPYLIKMDTHGFEVPILAGSERTLARTELLIIEAYNFTLRPGVLRFAELCQHMEGLGFRCLDVVDQLYRPDGTLWQFDMFFARADAPEFQLNSWS